jgi:hypothetical protein
MAYSLVCLAGGAANLAFVILLTLGLEVGFDGHSIDCSASILSLGALHLSETAGGGYTISKALSSAALAGFLWLGQ